jgi:acyl-CoA synthetase (AMP-forming)/AMP-acid ligase II
MSAPPTAGSVARRAAREFGDRPLLITPTAQLTFADADERSRALARRLLAMGVGKGTRVGVHFGYTPEYVVAFLAAARVGALVAPLSTTAPAAELSELLRQADVDTLLVPPRQFGRDELELLEAAVPELRDATPGSQLRLAALPYLRRVRVLGESTRPWARAIDDELDDEQVSDEIVERVEAEVTPADLLVLIQTSGSTAAPKGVLHTHGAVFRKTAVGIGTGPIYLAMPFFWVGGLLVLCAALQNGSTLVCQERFEPAGALDLIEQHRVTVVASWFTVTDALRNHPSVTERDLSCIPSLLADPRSVPYRTPLGMTETLGPHMTFPHPDHGMEPPPELRGSNGVTAPGFEHLLLDETTGEPVDGDGEGELCVRGDAVTVGLYKRERSEVFDADGWFHTGDRVARREGLWWFVGRTSEMIKVRGANVAPPQVEAVLESLPAVKHAFVLGVAHPERELDQQVAAVVVAREGASIDRAALQAAAASELSGYKVPSLVVELDEASVPWLATGKPDKRALRAMIEGRRSRPG